LLKLSPDGQFCMITSGSMKNYTCFRSTEPGKLLNNPFNGFDSSKLYYSDFTEDGAIVAINQQGVLLRINPADGTIQKQIAISAPDGEQLYPGGNEWFSSWFSNKDNTIFALRIYRPSESYNSFHINWLLVFDQELNIIILEEDTCNISDIKVFDSCIVMARSKASKPGQGRSKILRNYNEKKGRMLDQDAGDDLGVTIKTDSTFYFFNSPKKGVTECSIINNKITRNLPDLPLFKPKKGKAAIRVRVAKE